MAKNEFAQQLITVLTQLKMVPSDQAKDLHDTFDRSEHDNFVTFLLEEGLIDKEDMLKALSIFYKVPSFDVEGYFFDHQLLRDFPKDFLLRNEIIPLETDQDILIVIASDPNKSNLLPDLGNYTSDDIQFQVGIGLDIQDAIKEFYDKSLTEPEDMTEPLEDIQEEEEERELHELEDADEDFGE